jgi:hypothetical protein
MATLGMGPRDCRYAPWVRPRALLAAMSGVQLLHSSSHGRVLDRFMRGGRYRTRFPPLQGAGR